MPAKIASSIAGRPCFVPGILISKLGRFARANSSLAAASVLTSLRVSPGGWPRFMVGGLHRNLALLAVSFLGVHIVTAVVDPFTHLGWAAALVPFSSYYRTFWLGLGAIAAELLAAVVLSSLVRGFLGVGTWRAVGLAAQLPVEPVGRLHGLMK